jgi:2-polyprenyl-3-methyl-5-hydroxy-6-metoxy-1,4-benzoquinol methylase
MKNLTAPVIVLSTSSEKRGMRHSKTFLTKRMRERKAEYDRIWLRSPEKFRLCNATDFIRLDRTKKLLLSHTSSTHSLLDIGCGHGDFALFANQQGYHVTAVEITPNALSHLQKLKKQGIEVHIDQLPFLQIPDTTYYDIVSALDVLETLTVKEYRLSFSEISRLLSPKGVALISAELDTTTFKPNRTFLSLACTEFTPLQVTYSYHRFFKGIQAALRFLQKKIRLSFLEYLTQKFEKSILCAKICEGLTKALLGERGITHIIFLGKKRPLQSP